MSAFIFFQIKSNEKEHFVKFCSAASDLVMWMSRPMTEYYGLHHSAVAGPPSLYNVPPARRRMGAASLQNNIVTWLNAERLHLMVETEKDPRC